MEVRECNRYWSSGQGLRVSLWHLAWHGAVCRYASSIKGRRHRESRAMGVHARTLEFYRQFGFAEAVVERGMPAEEIRFRAGDLDGVGFSLRAMGAGLSPYPFMLTFPRMSTSGFCSTG